jgi:hypothetical protein
VEGEEKSSGGDAGGFEQGGARPRRRGAGGHGRPPSSLWQHGCSLDLARCGAREEGEEQEKKEKGERSMPRLRAGRRPSSTPAITGRGEDETLRRHCVLREMRERRKMDLGLLGTQCRSGFCPADTCARPSILMDGQRQPASHGPVSAHAGVASRPVRRPAGRLLGLGARWTWEDRPWAVFSRGPKRKVSAQYVL